MNKLFVGGISQETTEVDLFAYFKTFGPISSVRIAYDRQFSTRRSPRMLERLRLHPTQS
jgi:RNA recognition motif-containing protein